MPWEPGQSGNPKGQVVTAGIRLEARRQAVKALQTMVDAMDDEDVKVRLQAANFVLDRAYGKPTQPIGGDEDAAPIQAAIRVIFGRD